MHVDISMVLSKKFVINLEQPCASMCMNHLGTLLAVVGRKGSVLCTYCIHIKKPFIPILVHVIVFKILKIAPDQMHVSLDLRDLPGKQLNLNFSNNDVQWNPREGKFVYCASMAMQCY